MVMPWELSILDGAHALLLRAKLAIIGDTAITGDLGVSGEIIGGTIPIENLSNVDKQSFDSIIDNGDFKLWSAGNASVPDEWTDNLGDGSIAKSATSKINSSSVEITKPTSGSARIYQSLPTAYYGDRILSLGVWVKSANTVTDKISLQFYNGSSYETVYYQNSGDWEFIPITRELSSATSIRFYCSVSTDADAVAYFDGAIVVEGSICPAFSPKPLTTPHTYGEMYIYNNSNATVIETANTPIALRQISSGLQKGFIFHAGSTGAITAYFDYSGTVAGTVLVGDIAHGLITGDIITIRGSTNYNGIFEITKVNNDQFYIVDTWVVDDGASDWDKGASLTAQAGADGVYTSTWQMTTAPAGACELCFKVNINETPQNKSTACRDMAINDKDNNSSTCLMSIVEDDIIWLSVESDATSNIINSMGNMNLERM